MTVNSTLIAIIGTLLLAMGVGVLIGRSGNSTSAKSPPAQVVTVAGAAGATAGATSTQPASSGGATSITKSGASPHRGDVEIDVEVEEVHRGPAQDRQGRQRWVTVPATSTVISRVTSSENERDRSMNVIRRNRAASGEPATGPLGPGAPHAGEPDAGAPAVALPAADPLSAAPQDELGVDLVSRRDELTARFAELQYDLGRDAVRDGDPRSHSD